ncbi:MAG: hypothetical protein WCG47_06935 [Dermatophilaceae bacterium]
MLTVESRMQVTGLSGREVTDFLLNPTDAAYQAWWPGTHLRFHRRKPGGPDHVGDVVFMDELVGSRRLRMSGVVESAEPGTAIVWRLRTGIRLPVRLALALTDQVDGVAIRHTITAGWTGPGRLLDPLLRLYFSPRFAAAMDIHAHTEFSRLRDHLRAMD